MDRATFPEDFVVADGLPLARLYARFDAMAEGLTKGDSSVAHRSVIQRLAANQRRAQALGWTDFVLERRGGGGRLELRGSPAPGEERELVPDQIPELVPERIPASEPATPNESATDGPLPRSIQGHLGGKHARISWRARMRWLDDGGR